MFTTCAIDKLTIEKKGLYTLVPTPNNPQELVSMDYILGFPSTKHGKNCVFVVVDRFSKMAILALCKKSITNESTNKLFFECVWVHFGLQHTIISYRDSRFPKYLLVQLVVFDGH